MSVQSSPSDLAAQLRALPDDERQRLIESFTDDEAEALLHDWPLWARPKQLAPPGFSDGLLYSLWLVMAGRGFGKTRVGAEQVRDWIRNGFDYVNLIAATADDLRDVMVEGESGILAVCTRAERPVYRVSKRRLEWPNGAISLLFTAEEPDRLRGKQHTKLWADEVAAWRYAEESWDQAMFGLRIGDCPQTIATTTPRPTKIIRQLMAEKTTIVTRGTTYENRENLAPSFYSKIITKYEGTRLGRQELMAEVLDDNPGALWKRSNIDANRVKVGPPLTRIVVAVDPAVTSNPDSDETGIVAVGRDGRFPPHFYVLDDKSFIGTPDEWAKQAVNTYEVHQADRIIGEVNNGGDLVETVLRHQNANISYSKVTASRGKTVRAEPAAALYEQNRVHHVGSFPVLEDQMCVVAGTFIETARGQVPIESLEASDLVRTRAGFAPLKWHGKTGDVSVLVVICCTCTHVIVTPSHPVFLSGKFAPAQSAQRGHSLSVSPAWVRMARQSNGGVSGGGAIRKATSGTQEDRCSTGRSGKLITDLSQSTPTCTISTATPATTRWKISRFSPRRIMSRLIRRADFALGRRSGAASQDSAYGLCENLIPRSARSAASSISRSECGANTVAVSALNKLNLPGSVPVYNLSVADGYPHEFYANGILVHNCDWNPQEEALDSPDRMDALVWALTELADGMDSFAEYVKSEAKQMSRAGVAEPLPAAKVNVDGTTHERCECGSVVWNGNNCFKCGKARPAA